MADLIRLSPDEIAGVWRVVYPMVDSAYAAVDELVPRDLLGNLMTGYRELWLVSAGEKLDGIVITGIYEARSGRTLSLMVASGDLDALKSAFPEMKEYAKREGCRRIILKGRRGWLRALPGFDEITVTAETVI